MFWKVLHAKQSFLKKFYGRSFHECKKKFFPFALGDPLIYFVQNCLKYCIQKYLISDLIKGKCIREYARNYSYHQQNNLKPLVRVILKFQVDFLD